MDEPLLSPGGVPLAGAPAGSQAVPLASAPQDEEETGSPVDMALSTLRRWCGEGRIAANSLASRLQQPGPARVVLGVALVVIAALLGGIVGAIMDRRSLGPEAPSPPSGPGVVPPAPTPIRPRPLSPEPGASPAPTQESLPPFPPPAPLVSSPSPPPSGPELIVPDGEEPPPRPICHFHQPANAKDPTAKKAGKDSDGYRRLVFVNDCDGDLMVNIQGCA